MRKLVALAIMTVGYPLSATSAQEAVMKTAEAISQTETIKEITHNIEKTVNRVIPVKKETAAVVASVAITVSKGQIDTKPIKNMDVHMLKGSVRPDLLYDFNDKSSSLYVKYNFNW